MNTNNENKEHISFLKLKNNNGDDVYSIDKLDDTLVISPLIPYIDIFDNLTLYDSNSDSICDINMSEIFVDALVDAIERNTNYDDIGEKIGEQFHLKSKIAVREISECFPKAQIKELNRLFTKSYQKPNVEQNGEEPKKPYVRETPKVGVNDPCPCGSGKKYKQCCKQQKEDNYVG